MQGSFHSPFPEVASLPQGVLFVCTPVKEAELSSQQGWTAGRAGAKEEGSRQGAEDDRVRGYKEAGVLMATLTGTG